MYYLSEEGRFRKTANAFGIAENTVSFVICPREIDVCFSLTRYYFLQHVLDVSLNKLYNVNRNELLRHNFGIVDLCSHYI